MKVTMLLTMRLGGIGFIILCQIWTNKRGRVSGINRKPNKQAL